MMRKIEALENSRINDETKIKRDAGASKNNKLKNEKRICRMVLGVEF